MPIDIIIPVFTPKIPDALYECIESVIKNTKDFNLIIVGSEESQPKNVNKGLEKATSKYIVVVDWDIIVPEGWLDKMIKALEDNPEIGIIGPAQTGDVEKLTNIYTSETDDIVNIGSAIGACMVFRNIGLKWDENFLSGYWCDTDFGRQYKEKGYKIYLHGGVKIQHDIHTSGTPSKYVNDMMEDGSQVYFNKWQDLVV